MSNPAKKLEFPNTSNFEVDQDRYAFDGLSEMLHQLSGIHLPFNPKNVTLLSSRLNSVMKQRNLAKLRDYLKLLNTGNPDVISEFICKMTTNTTQFFRESAHFDYFAKIIKPYFAANPNREIRIWCAAASTGQEPYTIAMTLLEHLPVHEHSRIKFLATDIDKKVLTTAARGVYGKNLVDGVPNTHLNKYFDKIMDGQDECYQVNDTLAKMIRFVEFNLLTPQYPFSFPFDFIFCRNVLIYFRQSEINHVILQMHEKLRSKGILFVGHSESGTVRHPELKTLAHAVFGRK